MSAVWNRLACAVCGIALFAGFQPLASQSTTDAPRYLQQAILRFQQGDAPGAGDLLAAARPLDRATIEATPESHKLAGLVLLNAGREREAMPELLNYLKARPDAPDSAFLWYVLGNYNLQLRDYRRAGNAYRQAVLTARNATASSPPSRASPRPAPMLAPLTCPGESDDAAFWATYERNPFRDAEHLAALWNRGLSNGETALAAFASRLYIEETASDSSARILSEAVSRPGVAEELGPTLTAVLQEPASATNHQSCLQNLERLERVQLDLIARGALTPARERLAIVHRDLIRMHFARMAFLRDERSMYRYGSYMLRRGAELQGGPRRARALQALQALREALTASNPRDADPTGVLLQYSDATRLRRQTQILHQIADAYALLGRGGDHDLLESIAYVLADRADRLAALNQPNQSTRPPAVASIDRNTDANSELAVRRTVRKRCGENLNHREALLILLGEAHAARTNDASTVPPTAASADFYRRKLAERDQNFDEAELLSAFGR